MRNLSKAVGEEIRDRSPHHLRDLLQDKSGNQLLLQGREAGFGWAIVVDQQSGELTVTLANRSGAYVLYGACTVP